MSSSPPGGLAPEGERMPSGPAARGQTCCCANRHIALAAEISSGKPVQDQVPGQRTKAQYVLAWPVPPVARMGGWVEKLPLRYAGGRTAHLAERAFKGRSRRLTQAPPEAVAMPRCLLTLHDQPNGSGLGGAFGRRSEVSDEGLGT
jgi:hypothetical protein